MSAYVAVTNSRTHTPTGTHIRTICRPCDHDETHPRWHAALTAAREHNEQNHKPATP